MADTFLSSLKDVVCSILRLEVQNGGSTTQGSGFCVEGQTNKHLVTAAHLFGTHKKWDLVRVYQNRRENESFVIRNEESNLKFHVTNDLVVFELKKCQVEKLSGIKMFPVSSIDGVYPNDPKEDRLLARRVIYGGYPFQDHPLSGLKEKNKQQPLILLHNSSGRVPKKLLLFASLKKKN